ncbi:MAG: tRNA pseudouridine(38-40) synthase TruA [Nitrospirae bacterium]|nr:tRNA pseudouridine(38-40) synthase TruA [Nitrospirota bacterium]
MQNIRLLIEYDGTNYHGWQYQPDLPTIQGTIQDVTKRITGSYLPLIGAGRTDAGVHATGQVASFKDCSRLDTDSWRKALNSLLPADIAVLRVEVVPDDFHARYSAKGKVYEYRIIDGGHISSLRRNYTFQLHDLLDINIMRKASLCFLGLHDFSAYSSSRYEDKKKNLCNLKAIKMKRSSGEIIITLEADRFLHHMVRRIIGTLVEAGRGRIRPEDAAGILRSRDPRMAVTNLPPQGLFLKRVLY